MVAQHRVAQTELMLHPCPLLENNYVNNRTARVVVVAGCAFFLNCEVQAREVCFLVLDSSHSYSLGL